MISAGRSRSRRPTKVSSSRLARSAQCTSSSTTTAGPGARAARRWRRRSGRCAVADPRKPSPSSGTASTQTPRAAGVVMLSAFPRRTAIGWAEPRHRTRPAASSCPRRPDHPGRPAAPGHRPRDGGEQLVQRGHRGVAFEQHALIEPRPTPAPRAFESEGGSGVDPLGRRSTRGCQITNRIEGATDVDLRFGVHRRQHGRVRGGAEGGHGGLGRLDQRAGRCVDRRRQPVRPLGDGRRGRQRERGELGRPDRLLDPRPPTAWTPRPPR